MRYINLSLIADKLNKIPYEYLKNHLAGKHEDLVFNEGGIEYVRWKDIEEKLTIYIKRVDIDRKKFISENRDWNILQHIFLKEYGLKCWYSEAPIGNGDFEIDHFRPKNRSKQSDKPNDINLDNGYWWLSYTLSNYRLSGALANKRRRDRLKIDSDVEGKGDIFPLLKISKLAKEAGSCLGEDPVLLDPFCSSDPGLLFFDEDGQIYGHSQSDIDKFRANESIKYYNLDLDQLNLQRQNVWNACKASIEEANDFWIDDTIEYREKKIYRDKCFDVLRANSDIKSPFSSVAMACIKTYSRRLKFQDLLDTFNY